MIRLKYVIKVVISLVPSRANSVGASGNKLSLIRGEYIVSVMMS